MKLLLAEDDRIVRITVRDALVDAGYSVTECSDGAAAIAALDREVDHSLRRNGFKNSGTEQIHPFAQFYACLPFNL